MASRVVTEFSGRQSLMLLGGERMKKFLWFGLFVVAGFTGAAKADVLDYGFGFYGAIAYSSTTGSHGWATNMNSYYQANDAALSNCGALDCRIVAHVNNGCAAVSRAANFGFGYGIATSRWAAQSRAQLECNRINGACQPLAWVCTTGFY